MRLYSAKVPVIARDIIKQLVDDGDIEVANGDEATLDIEAVLKEYVRLDREITEQTKDLLERRNLPHGAFGKVKRGLADEKGFGLGEDGLAWICSQVLETFMHSQFIEEVYASDAEMRRKMSLILRRHMMMEEELDGEVRKPIRNMQEGTSNWDVEYGKVMDQIKRKRGIKP